MSQPIKQTREGHQRSHALQGQAVDTQSPSPMLEAHWETVLHNTSILYFKQAVLSLQVQPLFLSLANSCRDGAFKGSHEIFLEDFLPSRLWSADCGFQGLAWP